MIGLVQTIEDFPLEPQKQIKPNLSKMETEAIKTLANDISIVIKEADKGGATIIMDQSHYKDMVENTLKDKTFMNYLIVTHQKQKNLNIQNSSRNTKTV